MNTNARDHSPSSPAASSGIGYELAEQLARHGS